MNPNLEQAKHNELFHSLTCQNFPDSFYDWKITILFYVALHYLQALAKERDIFIGETHFDVERSVNPERYEAVMRISRHAWRDYRSLFSYSRTSRYEGFTDKETFDALKLADYEQALIKLDRFRQYIKAQGLA